MAEDNWDDKVRSAGPGPADNAAEADNTVESVTLAAENASLRDRLLRSVADAENTRRRAERSAADARQYAISDFAAELLAVVDNLQRAIASAGDRRDVALARAGLRQHAHGDRRCGDHLAPGRVDHEG